MLTLVAFVVLHVRVEEPPDAMDEGEAEKEIVGAFALTVIFAFTVVVPPAPFAVAVYVTVAFTTTVEDPESASAASSSPSSVGEIVTLVALLELHVKATIDPALTELALAENFSAGAGDPDFF
ncbi:MAG TPA: hypothetical protein VGL89_03845 [Candidatus Koribacter sp.]|jgi:hypothetical protein